MHIHLPKPLHGWPEFLGEVGIIVIGVLIALGAEQVVEAVHDRHVAAKTREALNDEIAGNLGIVEVRAAAEPCVERRLNTLRQMVDQWGRTGSFETPRLVALAPGFRVFLPRYEAAISSGRFARLSREEQYRFGSIVNGFRLYDELQAPESLAWAKLRILQSGPDALSETDRTVIRQALQEATYLDFAARTSAKQLLARADRFGFKPDMRQFRDFAPQLWKSGRFAPSICLDINTSPDEAARITGQVTRLPQ